MRHDDLLAIFSAAIAAAAILPGCNGKTDAGSLRCGPDPAPFTQTVTVAQFVQVADGLSLPDAAPFVGEHLSDCSDLCPGYASCDVTADDGGAVALLCQETCPGGRAPAGYVGPSDARGTGVADHFARMAALEGASVIAFRVLARELTIHRAPASLGEACRRAARDEIRHARGAGALARRYGGTPSFGRVRPQGARSLEAIAIENAVEGCARETFAALVASWQSRHASDPVVRAVMKRIARDETRHAALSWAIDGWARRRLSHRQRARLDAARAEACHALVLARAMREPPASAERIGLPSKEQAQVLARWLEGAISRSTPRA
jgi:hypothetical protein